MTLAAPIRRAATRTVVLDRSLEALPLFRLSDSAEEGAISYAPEGGGRWRVLPAPGDRLPGTFDQDVYVELMHRYGDAGSPEDGAVTFTLHAFLRSIGRRVDGRTYEQLRSALTRLERTTLESGGVYGVASEPPLEGSFTLLSSVTIERRRLTDRDQLALFSSLAASEPGDARVIISPLMRANIAAGATVALSLPQYQSLSNPVARRLYRLLNVIRTESGGTDGPDRSDRSDRSDQIVWRVPLERLAARLPLTQRYPSHLQRVLIPAHEMLITAGLLRDASFQQTDRDWHVEYALAPALASVPASAVATRNHMAP
ncbi:MAG: replication initiator protein A [Gemmatimonadaceae bacterium]